MTSPVRAEFFKPDSPDHIVGVARWDGAGVRIEAEDDAARTVLSRIFRPTAISVDDPALRTAGTTGPVVLPPGTLRWFQAAAGTRSQAEGLSVRLMPEGTMAMGWDPAGAYRTFGEVFEQKERAGAGRGGSPSLAN
jgi:hypothetical protein